MSYFSEEIKYQKPDYGYMWEFHEKKPIICDVCHSINEHKIDKLKSENKFKLPKKGIPVDLALNIKDSFSRDKKHLTVILSAALFQKTKAAPFKMKASIEGIFTGKDHKELKKFAEVHAPAHLMPFLREVIGNTTMKSNIQPLLLPPFNIAEIVKASKSKKKKA